MSGVSCDEGMLLVYVGHAGSGSGKCPMARGGPGSFLPGGPWRMAIFEWVLGRYWSSPAGPLTSGEGPSRHESRVICAALETRIGIAEGANVQGFEQVHRGRVGR